MDSFVLGFVLWASRLKQDMVVHGPVTRSGYRNMMELLETRTVIRPAGFHLIDVKPEETQKMYEVGRARGRSGSPWHSMDPPSDSNQLKYHAY